MRENAREEDHDMTMHLIKIHIFAHASRVTKLVCTSFVKVYNNCRVMAAFSCCTGLSTERYQYK